MATLKYFAQKSEDGYPIPSTMMGFKVAPPAGTLVEIPAANTTVGSGQTVKKPNSGLRYFVRRDARGNIIPNSLMTTIDKPKGLVYEFKVVQGTVIAAPSGIAVRVSRGQMGDIGACYLPATNLNVEITNGTSLSNALTITGDFASLGAYYTPADPNDGMAQPPRFDIAFMVDGVMKTRYFTLTGVGVASGADPMFGTSPAQICTTYWAGNLYRGSCDASLTTGTPLKVTTGGAVQVGKYYKVGQDAYLITGTAAPDGMAMTFDPATAYDTCAEALA